MEEERELKHLMPNEQDFPIESDIFSYYKHEGDILKDIEDTLFEKIDIQQNKSKKLRLQILRFISAAAVILVVLSIYINDRISRTEKLENEFFTMENALYQVAESLQPEEQEEMMVLWVDDNVEIIIH